VAAMREFDFTTKRVMTAGAPIGDIDPALIERVTKELEIAIAKRIESQFVVMAPRYDLKTYPPQNSFRMCGINFSPCA